MLGDRLRLSPTHSPLNSPHFGDWMLPPALLGHPCFQNAAGEEIRECKSDPETQGHPKSSGSSPVSQMLGEGGRGREVQEEVGLHRLKQSKKLREGEKRVINTNKAFFSLSIYLAWCQAFQYSRRY